jgi:hypothetical protein
MDTPTILKFLSLFTLLPLKIEQIDCSETSAYKIQSPGNYPEENIQVTCSPRTGNWTSLGLTGFGKDGGGGQIINVDIKSDM